MNKIGNENKLIENFARQEPSIARFEQNYRLPELTGSERQRAWARMIRREFLRELLDGVLDATKNKTPEEADPLYQLVDQIRSEKWARVWIEEYNQHLGGAIPLLFSLQAEQEEARERQARATESRRLNREAEAYEEQHDLPLLVAKSRAQQNRGRRCRYQLLNDVSGEQLAEILPRARREIDCGFWIGALTRNVHVARLFPKSLVRAAARPADDSR